MQHSSIHWFRKGLRLHDNPALLTAATDCCCLHPLFILNPSSSQAGTNAQRFLLDALRDLDGSLQKIGSRLFVVRGCPEEVFPSLFHAWGTTRLTFEVDTEPSARQRDATVAKLAAQHGVEVIQEVSHTLYDTERWVPGAVSWGCGIQPQCQARLSLSHPRVLALNEGKAPLTYKHLQSLLATLGPPEKPAPALTQEHLQDCHTPCQASHDTDYGVPNLEELGQDPTNVGPHLYPGGETAALTRLDALMERTAWVCSFQKPMTAPTSLSPSTTVLSPYLKFGCLSVRTFWWRLDQVYQGQEHSQPPTSLHGQLLWREFFYTAGASIPNFDRMVGNPVCLQVDWDNNPQHLQAWREGQTGYPFIDAIMTQLRTEGWIHHLARHAVACFLTRGDLWVSWEEGLKVRRSPPTPTSTHQALGGPCPHTTMMSHRSLRSSCWMLTGPSMLATGCGCQAVPSSTSISVFTHLLPLARRQTGTGRTFENMSPFSRISLLSTFMSPGKHRGPCRRGQAAWWASTTPSPSWSMGWRARGTWGA
ncbi:cryptochrome-2-like isoform X4 [Falco naumanni]|uniref:cryptochrome-2-like isoform X4 n=1 Tax=Falco naumanni TaxID=148594 RepID=UPI001ADEAD7C|nr:cryptochrome-2-like isoform X4 [Falco naumanni]